MKRLAFVLIVFALAQMSTAQPAIDFWRTYDCGSEEIFYDVFKVDGDGYVMCGQAAVDYSWHFIWRLRNDPQQGKIWLYRIEENGIRIWDGLYPDDARWGKGFSVIESDNGDFAVGGRIVVDNTPLPAALLIDEEGRQIWARTYGRDVGEFRSVIELKGGGFVFAGRSGTDGFVVSTDANGDERWSLRTNAGGGGVIFSSMRQTEGGIVLAGVGNIGGGSLTIWVAKVSFGGELIWERSLGVQANYAWCYEMVSNPRGGFSISGSSQNENFHRFAMYDMDDQGRFTDYRTYQLPFINGAPNCSGFGMAKLDDGEMVMVGYNNSISFPGAVGVSAEGLMRWREIYYPEILGTEFSSWTYLQAATRGFENSIVAVGTINWTPEDQAQRQDALFMKLAPYVIRPQIFYYSPHDTVLTVLQNDTVAFVVRAVDQQGDELDYLWTMGEDTLSRDTTVSIIFEELGEQLVSCFVTDQEFTASVRWHVDVRDLFIADYSPDTLNLVVRRGTSVTFSLDSVAVTEGDLPSYSWIWTDLDNFNREDAGEDSFATIEFLHCGSYQMAGTAYRGQSSDAVIWWIETRGAIYDFWPRELHLAVPPDSAVYFGLIPSNQQPDSVHFEWYLNDDLIGMDSTAQWIFVPPEDGNPVIYSMKGVAQEGAERDSVTWSVSVIPPDEVGKWASRQVGKWGLLSVSPNPFNLTTTIRYSTSGDAYPTRLTVHDLTGREVRECVSAEVQAGEHSYILNGADLPAGVYLIRLEAGEFHDIRKLVLLR